MYSEKNNSEQEDGSEKTRTVMNEEKCPACGDNLVFDPAAGCLKCPSCGTTKKIETEAGKELAFSSLSRVGGSWANETHIYHCANCNAEEALDKKEFAHVCPFCGSPSVVETTEIDAQRPNALLPFVLDKSKAVKAAVSWAKKRWFAPKEFKTYFRPENLNGVYLPAFTFDADTNSSYKGSLGEYYYVTVKENGKDVRKQHTKYFSVAGDYDRAFDDIAVNATDAVPQNIMRTLMRYDYNNSVEYKQDFLYGFTALLYSKSGEACWENAKTEAAADIRQGILSRYHYDVVQYLNVTTSYSNITYKYLLLPMYTGNYPYKNKTYSFYINGRSGKTKGKSPVAPARVAIAIGIGAVVLAALGTAAYFFAKWMGYV